MSVIVILLRSDVRLRLPPVRASGRRGSFAKRTRGINETALFSRVLSD
jgi:hypothetical protein